MLRVWVASGLARKSWAALSVLAATLSVAGTALAAAAVTFEGGPGTNAPPKKLHGVKLSPFAPDRRPLGSLVATVDGPTGTIKFSRQAYHDVVKHTKKGTPGHWMTWSHKYKGDVYFVAPSVTITLPAGTKAFSFYAEPNDQNSFKITATADGVSSGPVSVHGKGGAKFFGFVAKQGGHLSTITVTSTDHATPILDKHGKPKRDKKGHKLMDPGGFAVGEFAINGG
jgi:hypothetical protein